MTRINTNVGSIRGLRNLGKASSSLNTALERLSTGSQINRGSDNPAGLIAGESLGLQLTTIQASIDNSNRASNVLATADGALGEIGGLLNQVRGLVQQGLNSGALSSDEINANQLQIDAALNAIDRIGQSTSFAGAKLIDGSKAYTTQISSADAADLSGFQIHSALLGSQSSVAINASITQAATKGTLNYTGGAPTGDVTFEVAGNKGNQVLFFDSSSTIDDIATAVNAVTDATGVKATVATDAVAGSLDIASANSTDTLTITERRATSDTISVVFADGTASSGTSVSSVTGVGTGAVTLTIELGDDGTNTTATAQDIIDAINNSADASALVTASTTGSTDTFDAAAVGDVVTNKEVGELEFTSSGYGSDQFVAFNVLKGTFATTDSDGASVNRDTGSDVVANINGSRAVGQGLSASVKTSTLDATLTFTEAANVVGTDTSISVTGGGSLFQIGQEVSANGQLGIGIDAVNTGRLGGVTGKLYELGTGRGKSLLDIGNGANASDLVQIVDDAVTSVATLRGRLGAIQKNVIETNASALGVAQENITQARSQIVDTDFASATAALTRAQILSQAGISVLSIANQTPQQVLQLLR